VLYQYNVEFEHYMYDTFNRMSH